MVESIRGKGFAYAHEVEEERQKELVKTRAKGYREKHRWLNQLGQKTNCNPAGLLATAFYRGVVLDKESTPSHARHA
jgi:hypothetical protein